MNQTRATLPTDLSLALAATRDALDGFASTVHYYAVADPRTTLRRTLRARALLTGRSS